MSVVGLKSIAKNRRDGLGVSALQVVLVAVLSSAATAQTREPIEPIPLCVEVDPARAELGARLFQDVRLSGDGTRSCASCHPLDRHGVDGLARARATGDLRIMRNTPTLLNVGFNRFLNWDGAFEVLTTLDEKVLLDPALLGGTWPKVLSALKADSEVVARFRIYPAGITRDSVLDALESFERSWTTPNARFDKFLRGDKTALNATELRGYQLFKSYGCVSCHQGVNVGGNLFQKFGVFAAPPSSKHADEPADPGRYAITGDPRDLGVFRVPSLRNVALTAPYFHDGDAASLEDAVETMARAQLGRTLNAAEVFLIVQFLGTLTGESGGTYRAPNEDCRR